MDLDDSGSDWGNLGHDLHLSILSVLKQRKDKDSLQAVMQTSRDLRLLASSLISAIEVRDASALARYPTHAAAITSMRLKMRRRSHKGVRMESPGMVIWLQATSAACFKRLAAVTIVHVELPHKSRAIDPATMDSLLASIAQACPSLHSLSMESIDRTDEDLIRAMFTAIGQHLPGIIELQLRISTSINNFAIAGIDWAVCLPRGMQKFTSKVNLHHELLQQLVLMPALTAVDVWGLSIGGEELLEVQSDACTWRILRLESRFPSCLELGRFTAPMPLLHLICDAPTWVLGSAAQGPAIVARAAAWLSQIQNRTDELSLWFSSAATRSTASLISSLAPIPSLVSLQLSKWPVTEGTLDELAEALPNMRKLTLNFCSISDSAWPRMASLTSVTELTIDRFRSSDENTVVPLAQIIAFTSAISRPMSLTLKGGCVSAEDQAGWEAFEEEQRRNNGQLQVTVRITQKR